MSFVIYNSDDEFGHAFHGYFDTESNARNALPRVLLQVYHNFLEERDGEYKINHERLQERISEAIMILPIAEYQERTGDFD